MKLKTPSFWYESGHTNHFLWSYVLSPFSLVYGFFHDQHQKNGVYKKISVPVVCIGNLTAGGAGKTPTALAIMDIVREHNIAKTPYFLTRGYGGRSKAPTLVDKQKHAYQSVGDEALLLVTHAPTVVSRNRYQGALHAIEHGADMIIMDDGLQNTDIHKDISVTVIDGAVGFGNQKRIPAGPLRDSLDHGLNKTDIAVIIGEDVHDIHKILPKNMPCLSAHVRVCDDLNLSQDKNYLAFTGLGRPEKFFNFLKNTLRLSLSAALSFPDHYPYTEKDVQDIKAKAQQLSAQIVTTEKDYVRIPEQCREDMQTIPIKLVFEDEKGVIDVLKSALKNML